MSAVQINVTVDGMDGVDLTTVVGDEIAYYNPETEDTEHQPRTLGDLVAEKVTKKLTQDDHWSGARKRFLEVRDEEIRAAVKPIVEAAISGPIQKTNSYGEPTGATTTLRELIVAEASALLNRSADNYNSRGETVLAKFIREQIAAAFTKELAAVVADEKAKVVAAVRAKAADLIAEAVKQGVGPR